MPEYQMFTTSAKCYTFSYTFVTLFFSSISVTLLLPKIQGCALLRQPKL